MNQGLPKFGGLKITQDRYAADTWKLKRIRLALRCDTLLLEPGTIGSGGNSGFQAVNAVLQFGCRDIVLVGFDLTDRAGIHWHGKHGDGLINPQAGNLARWRRVLDAQAELLKAIGARVVVAGQASALTAYPKLDLMQAIKGD